MIIRPHLNWISLLLAWRGSVLPRLVPRLLIVFVISLVAVLTHDKLFGLTISLSPAPFSLVGIALAVFLGFRNNASYDRYWEARKLWGQLLNTSRSIARQALTLGVNDVQADDTHALVQVLRALPHALRHQLRGTDPRDDLAARLPPALLERAMASRYRAATLMLWLGEWTQARRREGTVDAMGMLAFDRSLETMSDVIGGCERISSTPLPFAYTVMIHRTVYFFCASLPFGLVDSIGGFTPVFAVLVAYTFMAHEAIAAQLEEPFGTDDNDLALTAMSFGTEDAVCDLLGESAPERPAPVKPFVLD